MADKKRRIDRLKASDPICYFCASRPTETEDHVPSRECFRDRIWPDGFTFPACAICNNGAGRMEQVVALYLHMANFDATVSNDQLQKLLAGVRNNSREMLPNIQRNANLARKHFREKGIQLPRGGTFGDSPIATLPVAHREAMELFGRRLTCAIYYKEVGHPLPIDYYIASGWIPWLEAQSHDVIAKAVELFPSLTITNRRNTDIGDQFKYKWGWSASGIFGFVAQFSKSYFFLGAASSAALYQENSSGVPGWKPHAADVTL